MEINIALYKKVPILIKEGQPEENPWEFKINMMFHMTTPSHLFHSHHQLEADGWALKGNIFYKGNEAYMQILIYSQYHNIGYTNHKCLVLREMDERPY